MNRNIISSGLLCFFLFFSACGILGTFRDVTAGNRTRVSMLNERLNKFNQAVYWGVVHEATQYVLPEQKDLFYEKMNNERAAEKRVDLKIENIQFDDDGKLASILVSIRYYRVPSYIVYTRQEQQTWEFHRFKGGWLYHDSQYIE